MQIKPIFKEFVVKFGIKLLNKEVESQNNKCCLQSYGKK